ncbi:F0F1 ATP synthase subunit delta [Meridianimarinicoccus aquatilis]|uniref:ATP synthase subunit delta n=1 Tax=Meridianimarinicoccus aquatilis TaxID=2552766 RepID=A0A4V3BCT0_9RHOB|nr:F0F1 ATP synthase subunit delta [Fluviibacterium aquatile]QIE42846.1 F0F1 ATP synthase subunit delta [Rhodobacteraceae bacterium SC52]TDL91499.1 F0F1 ATP synthase subunit delta [Fluviibacterium aquatile]
MSEPASISTGIAARYAKAMFELAQSDNQVDVLESDVDTLDAALHESTEFAAMVHSPLYSRQVQQDAMTALSGGMGLSTLMTNTLALMASKRRLFVLPQLVRVLRDMIADEKGIVTAEVSAATALTEEQTQKLADTLKANIGKDVKIKTIVDESLIGGLVVKVGSRMIDLSVAAKLANLQHAMKEVG